MDAERTIIPVAGGKGGVGKTLLTANLAIALAEQGHETIAVDLDLGSSNLHSFLGLRNEFPGVGDYLRGRPSRLQNFLVETDIPRLRFVPGDGRMPFMANITHYQKRRLISDLNTLPARYVLLDLGAGSSFNVLDFFRIVGSAIVVTTPEYPSIMSMLVFLKNVLLRAIETSVSKDAGVVDLIQEMYFQPMVGSQKTVPLFQKQVEKANRKAAVKIERICQQLRPRIIYNMGDNPSDLEVLPSIDKSLKEILGLECDHLGFIFADTYVRESIKKKRPIVLDDPEGPSAHALRQIASRIIRFWNQPIPNSAELLTHHTQNFYENLAGSRNSK
jgi:flagellar biosynthesis protein FlhG